MTEAVVRDEAAVPRSASLGVPPPSDIDVPLFVDLDGTLVKTDLLLEGVLALLRRRFWYCFSLMLWLLRGKALFKSMIARQVTLDANMLPLQGDFVQYLLDQSSRGRQIFLATASNRAYGEKVAQRLGIFAGVIASDDHQNLRGEKKLKAILAATEGRAFDYAGNARVDLRVWVKARRAIIVNPDMGVCAAARKLCVIEEIFDDRPHLLRTWGVELRLYQWLKNLLLAVPLLTAHVFDVRSVGSILLAYLAMGCVASATYILNDLMDLSSDRRHPRKCKRPFAAGDLPIGVGLAALGLLITVGLGIAAIESRPFLLILLVYLFLTLAYSLHLKAIALVDVILLAALYTVRIIAGAAVIHVGLSSWLLVFSMFMFLSIALVKRSSELVMLAKRSGSVTSGRDYRADDGPIISAMGIASGYISILVLALYIDSPQGRTMYSHPDWLWLLCPMLFYWVSRLWIKTGRGEMHDDPLLYSTRDQASLLIGALMVLVTILAIE